MRKNISGKSEEVALERITKKDFPFIVRVLKKEFIKEPYNEPWTQGTALTRVKEALKYSSETCFLIKYRGKRVGFILGSDYCYFDGRRCFIEEFAIDSKYQNKGIGSKALKMFVEKMKSNGFAAVVLSSHKKARAFNFYKKLGFKETGWMVLEKGLKNARKRRGK